MRLLMLGVLLVVASACDVCSARDETVFSGLRCTAGSGPGSVTLQPSVTAGGNASITDARCVASVDAGMVFLRLTGTVCEHAFQNLPVVATLSADCVVTGLGAGTWSVGGGSTVVVRSDGGVELSACSR